MRFANLLLDNADFARLNADTNANQALLAFLEAFEKAKDSSDSIYAHPDLWIFEAAWQEKFIEIFNAYELAQSKLPWIDFDIYNSLCSKIFELNTTDVNATSLTLLNKEFKDENNGILCSNATEKQYYVFDLPSWYQLHCNYITKYPEYIDWSESEVFTNTEYSDLCIFEMVDKYPHGFVKKKDKIHYFNTELVRSVRDNKATLYDLAVEIAKRNGYIYDDKLTKSEKKRRGTRLSAVFKVKKHGVFQYLSLDTENGQFEVCDKRGNHIGVWNFSGTKTHDADKDGGHDIKL